MTAAFLVENRNQLRIVSEIAREIAELGIAVVAYNVRSHDFLDLDLPEQSGVRLEIIDADSEVVQRISGAAERAARHELAAGMIEATIGHAEPPPVLGVVLNDIGRVAKAFLGAARRRGAITCLVQDGFVEFAHAAPNHRRQLGFLDSGYLGSGPDIGLFWGEATRKAAHSINPGLPVSTRVIGCTTQPLSSTDESPVEAARDVLFVDQCFVRYNQMSFESWRVMMAEWLRALVGARARSVTVRPHPSQDDRCMAFLDELSASMDGVEVESSAGPVADAVARHSVVAGFYSTVLIEALHANVPVLALDDDRVRMWLPPIRHERLQRIADPSKLPTTGDLSHSSVEDLTGGNLSSFVADLPWAKRAALSLWQAYHGVVVADDDKNGWRRTELPVQDDQFAPAERGRNQ